jgi:hypothetical protein
MKVLCEQRRDTSGCRGQGTGMICSFLAYMVSLKTDDIWIWRHARYCRQRVQQDQDSNCDHNHLVQSVVLFIVIYFLIY